jgi:hypothetical protein
MHFKLLANALILREFGRFGADQATSQVGIISSHSFRDLRFSGTA